MQENKEEKKKITIVTHSGHFHSDEIFAVAALSLMLGENDIEIIRSREMEVIEKADYVLDVGGIYDPKIRCFDHHQEGGAGSRPNGIPFATFGLIWKTFGKEISGSIEVSEKIDEVLAQPIDAVDNGVNFIQTSIPNLYMYNIGNFFQALYPSWKEELNVDEVFMQAVSYAKVILSREIKKYQDFFAAKESVIDFYNKSQDKRVVVFDKYYPSNEFLKQFPEPLFTVFPRDDGKWGLNTIQDNDNSFENRKSLPAEWAGKKEADLEKITGVPGAFFCHRGRFIAVAETKEAILQLAELALKD